MVVGTSVKLCQGGHFRSSLDEIFKLQRMDEILIIIQKLHHLVLCIGKTIDWETLIDQ